MDARPILLEIAGALRQQNLEAILIGNAAAALQGAPVTTLDVDFLFRRTPLNLRKLKAAAKSLGAVVFAPYYLVSGMFRLVREDDSLQVDFMTRIHGIRSFNSIRRRASALDLGGEQILVANLSDIIASKRAAGRPRDHAVLDVLEKTLRESRTEPGSKKSPRSTQEGK